MTSLDSFPEAFERFEYDVDIGQFESYQQLTMAFRYWAGERWRGTNRQWEALNAERRIWALNRQILFGKSLRVVIDILGALGGEK